VSGAGVAVPDRFKRASNVGKIGRASDRFDDTGTTEIVITSEVSIGTDSAFDNDDDDDDDDDDELLVCLATINEVAKSTTDTKVANELIPFGNTTLTEFADDGMGMTIECELVPLVLFDDGSRTTDKDVFTNSEISSIDLVVNVLFPTLLRSLGRESKSGPVAALSSVSIATSVWYARFGDGEDGVVEFEVKFRRRKIFETICFSNSSCALKYLVGCPVGCVVGCTLGRESG
jgi:hypothetical protein